ncbi:hypothetical protein M0R45_014194 [Rubus argutus]|uniref:2,4-dienoyl-CoA reductase [(3E)-enoyl-CoA-producing] n=1 Tax=Rubus argutus TaxID=59490 RepID=A0AAW1XL00_RUBAR
MESSPFKADALKGKVALITGGGTGIGFEISTQLGKHGASIAIMGLGKQVMDSAVSALHSLGIPAIGMEGDLAIFSPSPEDLSPNAFRTVLGIDSVGTYTMCYEALKYLKKGGPGRSSSGGGTILNISATLHYTASWYQIHTSAAKAAVDATTRNLALEWGTDYDIRINGIAPGPIGDTPGISKLLPKEIESSVSEFMPLFKLAGPRFLPKDAVKQLSRVVEERSRKAPVGVPSSKL